MKFWRLTFFAKIKKRHYIQLDIIIHILCQSIKNILLWSVPTSKCERSTNVHKSLNIHRQSITFNERSGTFQNVHRLSKTLEK